MRYLNNLQLQKQQAEQQEQMDQQNQLLNPIRDMINKHYASIQVRNFCHFPHFKTL